MSCVVLLCQYLPPLAGDSGLACRCAHARHPDKA
jgi:hypothetical protein